MIPECQNADMEEVKEIINDIVKEDTRAGEIIDRMRALLKKTKMEVELVDLNSVFREIAMLLNSESVMRDVKFDLELYPRAASCRGDRIEMK